MPKNNSIQITDETWEKIKYEYITTDISMRGIQKKYGIPFNRIKTKVDNENWNADREEYKAKIKQKSIDLLAEHNAEECTRAFRIANRVMDKLEECIERIDATDDYATKNLKNITSAIKDLKEIGVFRSALDEQEQRARIRKLQKDAEEEQKDNTITVVFEGDMEGDFD